MLNRQLIPFGPNFGIFIIMQNCIKLAKRYHKLSKLIRIFRIPPNF